MDELLAKQKKIYQTVFVKDKIVIQYEGEEDEEIDFTQDFQEAANTFIAAKRDEYLALIDWIDGKPGCIKPPDPNPAIKSKDSVKQREIYQTIFVKDKIVIQYEGEEDEEIDFTQDFQEAANTFIAAKRDEYLALIDWIDGKPGCIKPPDPSTAVKESSPPAEDPELLAAMQDLIAKVKGALEAKANRDTFFPSPGTFNLEEFKTFLRDEFSDEVLRKTLEKLVADDKKFREELEAMMLRLEGNPFTGDKKIIGGAIDSILAEFKSIVDGIGTSGKPPGAPSGAPPGAPPGVQPGAQPGAPSGVKPSLKILAFDKTEPPAQISERFYKILLEIFEIIENNFQNFLNGIKDIEKDVEKMFNDKLVEFVKIFTENKKTSSEEIVEIFTEFFDSELFEVFTKGPEEDVERKIKLLGELKKKLLLLLKKIYDDVKPPLIPQKSSSLDSLSSFGSSSSLNVGSLGEPSQTSNFEEYLAENLRLLVSEERTQIYKQLQKILENIFAFVDAKKYTTQDSKVFDDEFTKLLEMYISLFSNSSKPIPPETIVKVLDDFLESDEGLKSLNERFETDKDKPDKINSLGSIKLKLISLLQNILEAQKVLSSDKDASVGEQGAVPEKKPAKPGVDASASASVGEQGALPEKKPAKPGVDASASESASASVGEQGAVPAAAPEKPPVGASVGPSTPGSPGVERKFLQEKQVNELEAQAKAAVEKLTSSRATSSDEELETLAAKATQLQSQAAAARATYNLANAFGKSGEEKEAAMRAEKERLEKIIRDSKLAIDAATDQGDTYTVDIKNGELKTATDSLGILNDPTAFKLSIDIEGSGKPGEEKKELESLVHTGNAMDVFLKIEEKSLFEEKEVLRAEEEKLRRLQQDNEDKNNPGVVQQINLQQRKIDELRKRLQESTRKFELEKVEFQKLDEQLKKDKLLRLINQTTQGSKFTETQNGIVSARKKLEEKAALIKQAGDAKAAALTASQQEAVRQAADNVADTKKQAEFLASERYFNQFNKRYFDGTDFTSELSNIEKGINSTKTNLQYSTLGKIRTLDTQLFNPNAKEETSVQIKPKIKVDDKGSEITTPPELPPGITQPVKKGGARKTRSQKPEEKPGILNEINTEFKPKETKAKETKDKYEGERGFIAQLKTINAKHKPEPDEGGSPSFITQQEGRRGDDIMKSYLNASRSYLTEYSLPYTYKKLINLFIYYITYYNKFKNSFLIKKLENLRNSSKYKDASKKDEIDRAFRGLADQKIAGTTQDIDSFFEYHFHLNGNKFTYILPLVQMLKVDGLDQHRQTGLDDKFIKNYKEIVTDLIKLFQGAGVEQTREAVANIKISDLNQIIFKYISVRFPLIRNLAEYKDLNLLYFEHDIALLGFMYFIILKLAENFKDEYNTLIAEIFNDQDLYSVVSSFFNQYSDSSVISYVKIRDGANEKDPKNQLSNPRYIYYSDIDFTENKGRDGLSLGLEEESPSATLSLFYCNNPTQELKIPEYKQYWLEKKARDKRLISGNDLILETLNYDKLDDENANIFPKYDHLFHFGHFNKILHNDNNEKFGNKMTEVITKLTSDPLSDVFIIGYGASGAGKTTTLIYDKNQPEGKRDGAVVYMLNKLAKDQGANYQEITLTITELFMAEPNVQTKATDIFPTLLNKITNQEFTYKDGIFKANINYEKYKQANDAANTGLPQAMESKEYKELFLQKGAGLDFQGETKDFTLSEILQLLIDKKRKVSGTTNNPQSSRSHVLSSISFTKVKKGGTQETLKLYIGDFAGVENKFDYSSFTYGNDLYNFPTLVLKEIYKLASMTDDQFPNDEDGIYLRDYQTKVKALLQVEQAEQLAPQLEELENINALVHTICLLNSDLLGKTIKDYAFLKHPREKYQEVYDKKYGRGKWKEEIAGTSEEEKFDKQSPLVYFYELLKSEENQDSQLMKKVGEMIPMIKFLTDPKTGYGDSYDKLPQIERIIKKQEDEMGPSIFKPQNTGSKSVQQLRFEGKKEAEIQKMNSNELEKAGVEEKYGLLNPYVTRAGEPIKYPLSSAGQGESITKFEIKHPGINLINKSEFLKTLQGVNLMTLKAQPGLDNEGILQVIQDTQTINPDPEPSPEDKRKGIAVWVSRKSDKMGVGMIRGFPTVSHNRILAAICSKTLKNWLIEKGVKATFSKGGNAWGNIIEKVELQADDQFNFIITNLQLADFDKMINKLGLITHVYKLQDSYNMNRNYRLTIAPDVDFDRNDLLGTQVGTALDTLQDERERERLKQQIIENFNNPNAEERDEKFGALSYGGGVVKDKMTFNELKRLLLEAQSGEVKTVKDKIRTISSKDTAKIDQKIKINMEEISKLDKLIKKEIDDQEKYLMLAEAAIKRIYHIHYEVIKRTYEGLFINKSLEQMRFTMTDVLQATNKANGQSSSLVPNFNSKCTNYYSNVLLEDLFQENTGFDFSDSGEIDDDEEDQDKVDNRNRFNVIHQIIAKNKITGSESPEESPGPYEETPLEEFDIDDLEEDSINSISSPRPPPLGRRASDVDDAQLEQLGGSVRQVGGKEKQVPITKETESYKIIQDTITQNLKGGITYCVCLLLNNSYIETQNNKLVNNPPKIPYIDLTEAYTELNRFYRRNKYIEVRIPKPSNLVFVKYYSDKDKEGGPSNYLLTKSVRKSIEEITGFRYEEFTSKNFHIHIFENINTYMLYCYSAAIKNFTIPPGKIIEINNEFVKLKELADTLRGSMDGAGVHTIQAIINQAKKYLFLIEVMNGTSVIGTIDFADEISKYNLKYNKSSVSQFNILHKTRSELYASDYDYLRRFRYFYEPSKTIDSLALGVHAFIPITPSVRNLVWRCFILPALLKLGEDHSIYHSLIKNKMKICLEHSTNPLIKEILKPFREGSKDLMKLTTVEIDDQSEYDDNLKQVNVQKESFDIIKVSKANKNGQPEGQPEGQPVLKFEVPQASSAPGTSIELDYPEDYNEDDDLSAKEEPLVAKLNALPEKLIPEKIAEKIKNIKNQRVYIQKLIAAQSKSSIAALIVELEKLKTEEQQNKEKREAQAAKDSRFNLYNQRYNTQIKEGEEIILLGSGGTKAEGRTLQPTNIIIPGTMTNDDGSTENVDIEIPAKTEGIVVDVHENGSLLNIEFTNYDIKSAYPEHNVKAKFPHTSLGLVNIVNTGEQDEAQIIGSQVCVITKADFPKYDTILQREEQLAAAQAEDERRAALIQERQQERQLKEQQAREEAAQRRQQLAFEQQQPRGRQVRQGVGRLNPNQFEFRTGQGVTRQRPVGFGSSSGRGGSKTRKYSKLKLKQPKKIERKYKQSLKNKVKLNHSQVNRSKLPNEVANNKTKKHLRLKLIKKKKNVRKYKQSLKNKK